MEIVLRLLMVFEAIVCFLLIGIVLLQRSKGQGAGLSFGGGAEAVFGAQMGNVLTRTTVVLAVLFLANTTLIVALPRRARARSVVDRIPVKTATVPVTPAASAPAEMDSSQVAALLDSMDVEATDATAVAEEAAAVVAETTAAAGAQVEAAVAVEAEAEPNSEPAAEVE